MNDPQNEARTLDEQWNNRSTSTKFSQQINMQMGIQMQKKGQQSASVSKKNKDSTVSQKVLFKTNNALMAE